MTATFHQLNPPMPVETPRGKALAHFLLDYGPEHHVLWGCFIDTTRECWWVANPEIRAQSNPSLGRGAVSEDDDVPDEGRVRVRLPNDYGFISKAADLFKTSNRVMEEFNEKTPLRYEWVNEAGNTCWFSPGFDPNKAAGNNVRWRRPGMPWPLPMTEAEKTHASVAAACRRADMDPRGTFGSRQPTET